MKYLSSALLLISGVSIVLASPAPLVARASATSATVAGCAATNLAGVTRNDITSGLPCKEFTLIFARGTTESGNIGDIVGPPFVDAFNSILGADNVAVQGVNNYSADVLGFLVGGSPSGSVDMALLIEQTMTQCPNTKLCVSGYSQGAQVAHNAADLISDSATDFINSVVLFGDPDDGEPFGRVPASKVSTDCHVGDDICLHGILVLEPHRTYCEDVGTEAAFAVGQSGL